MRGYQNAMASHLTIACSKGATQQHKQQNINASKEEGGKSLGVAVAELTEMLWGTLKNQHHYLPLKLWHCFCEIVRH